MQHFDRNIRSTVDFFMYSTMNWSFSSLLSPLNMLSSFSTGIFLMHLLKKYMQYWLQTSLLKLWICFLFICSLPPSSVCLSINCLMSATGIITIQIKIITIPRHIKVYCHPMHTSCSKIRLI